MVCLRPWRLSPNNAALETLTPEPTRLHAESLTYPTLTTRRPDGCAALTATKPQPAADRLSLLRVGIPKQARDSAYGGSVDLLRCACTCKYRS